MGAYSNSVVARLGLCLGLALGLGGCGTIPNLLGQTTEAVLGPITDLAQQANMGLQTAGTTVTSTATSMASAAGTSSAQLANYASAATGTAGSLVTAVPDAALATSSAAPTLTSAQKDAIAKAKTAPQPDLPVLPDDTLAKLTPDQLGLQNTAQRAALTAPVGETIYWSLDGRDGTVSVKDEHTLGDLVCRAFSQSITIDGKVEEARATACLDADSHRWALAF